MKKTILSTLVAVILMTSFSWSQCALIPISLEDRINASDVIVEASIVGQEGFRETISGNIYTTNYLKVYKVFKGNTANSEIVLISPGGSVGDSYEQVTPSISVTDKTTGIFFLKNTSITGDIQLENYQPYSGPQGCIYYNSDGSGNDVFDTYQNREEIYSKLENSLGEHIVINKLDVYKNNSNKSGTPLITSISPDTVAAGIKVEMTVRGRDFGNIQGIGTIEFTNASTGSQWVSPSSSEILFWSDTTIIVRVPSGAGTGALKVIQGGTAIIFSPVIKFAHLNYNLFSKVKEPFHKDNNTNGGFTWRMSTGFNAKNGPKNAFIRAMNTWRDNTCINWENGSTTSVDADREDGVNIVRFAASNELPSGVLGITRNRWKNCGPTTSYTKEIDLSYDPDVNWYAGTNNPSFNQHDMESVIVHELGHAHQLGHVIDTDDFMHATIGQGQKKRDLIDNDIEAGLYIMKNSVVSFDCGPDPMTALSGCTIPVGIDNIAPIMDVTVFPNPFSEILYFSNLNEEFTSIQVFDLTGKIVSQAVLNNMNGQSKWTVPDSLEDGIYFIKNATTGQSISKVILKR